MAPDRDVAVDSSALVALISERDSQHLRATELFAALAEAKARLVYFDCAVTETLGVLARRAEEQRRPQSFATAADTLLNLATPDEIVWTLESLRTYFRPAVALMRETDGALNFNDALICLTCRAMGVGYLASFDPDFDRLDGIVRLADGEAVRRAFPSDADAETQNP